MINLILFLLCIIMVPVAMIAVVAIYVTCKMALILILESIGRVYRYASGKTKDNETPSPQD